MGNKSSQIIQAYIDDPSEHHEQKLKKLYIQIHKESGSLGASEWQAFAEHIDKAVNEEARRETIKVVEEALEKSGNVGAYRDTGNRRQTVRNVSGQSINEFLEEGLIYLEGILIQKRWSSQVPDFTSGEMTFKRLKNFLDEQGQARIDARTKELLEKLANHIDKMGGINLSDPTGRGEPIYLKLPGLTGDMIRPASARQKKFKKVPSSCERSRQRPSSDEETQPGPRKTKSTKPSSRHLAVPGQESSSEESSPPPPPLKSNKKKKPGKSQDPAGPTSPNKTKSERLVKKASSGQAPAS